jgi:maltose alpha-D-glucosyltransferase/alpha-amylase
VELDLAAADRELEGMTPVEVFGRTPFPRIGEWPYLLTLGPHGFYWFVLERERLQVAGRPVETAPDDGLPVLDHPGDWHALLQGDGRRALEAALGKRLADHPAFGGALRAWRGAAVRAAVPVTDADRGVDAALVLLEIEYTDGEPELYGLFLACAEGEEGERVARAHGDSAYLRLRGGATTADAVMHDALLDRGVAAALLAALRRRRRFRAGDDELAAVASPLLRLEAKAGTDPVSHFSPGDGSTVVLGERWVLRTLRRLEPGANPGLELARYLAEEAGFPHTPRTGGWLELRHQEEPRRGATTAMTRAAQAPVTVAVLQEFVRNQGSAGAMARDAAGRFFERVLAHRVEGEVPPPADAVDAVGLVERARLWRAAENGDPTAAPTGGAQGELLGPFPEAARQLGVLTAELHRTLAAAEGDLAPEPFTTLARRSVYQSLRSAAGRHLRFLDQHLGDLDDAAAAAGRDLLQRRDEVLQRLAALLDCKLDSLRIRTHGHLHLGQLLSTGRGFMIVGFRGDPGRRYGERRIKRSPLTDVASLLRSLYSAADDELQRQVQGGLLGRDDVGTLGGWVGYWQRWVSAACLSSYLECVGDDEPRLVPSGSRELAVVLDVYQLERALNEMRDTLTRHPHRAAGVLTAVLDLLRERP